MLHQALSYSCPFGPRFQSSQKGQSRCLNSCMWKCLGCCSQPLQQVVDTACFSSSVQMLLFALLGFLISAQCIFRSQNHLGQRQTSAEKIIAHLSSVREVRFRRKIIMSKGGFHSALRQRALAGSLTVVSLPREQLAL